MQATVMVGPLLAGSMEQGSGLDGVQSAPGGGDAVGDGLEVAVHIGIKQVTHSAWDFIIGQ